MGKLNSSRKIVCLGLAALVALCGFSATAAAKIDKSVVKAKIARLSVPFIENRGQTNSNVAFYAHTFGGTVFVTRDGQIVYSLPGIEKDEKRVKGLFTGPARQTGVAIKEGFLNGVANREIEGGKKTITRVNIFKGKDSNQWRKNIPVYDSVYLGEIYKGIELKLKAYGNNVEKIFIVKSGASPCDIKITLKGVDNIKLNKKGELVLESSLGEIKFTRPVAYQKIGGKKKYVKVAYKICKDTYTFALDNYDKSKTLIIDPLLASTFLGGNNFDKSYSIALDTNGNVFLTGWTESSDFPTTPGTYDTSFNSTTTVGDLFISKLNNNLSELIAFTYLGGSNYDWGVSIALDTNGNVFVTGGTDSSDFPVTPSVYDTSYNGSNEYNVIVSKLDNNLSQLLASTFIGRATADSIALNTEDGKIYVYLTGRTESSDFPTTTGAYDTSFNGSPDVFVSKLKGDLSTLLASTFLGGWGYDYGYSITLDTNGNVYVTGNTSSGNFPTTTGAYDTTQSGSTDLFISKLNNNLSTLLASTFLNMMGSNFVGSIALDTNGNVFVTGETSSSDFPTIPGAYDTSFNGGYSDIFISKLDNNLSMLLASTFLGGSNSDESYSIVIDANGNVFVTGCTGSSDFPTAPGAFDTSYNAGTDVFVSKLDNDLSALLSSTFLGRQGKANSITLDTNGNVFVTGTTTASDFPTIPGAYDTSYNGSVTVGDAFISKFDNNLSAGTGSNQPPVIDSLTANPTSGSAPLSVTFTCTAHDPDGTIASYKWDFDGDGTIDLTTSSGTTTHIYDTAGAYNAQVTIVDNDVGETTSTVLEIMCQVQGESLITETQQFLTGYQTYFIPQIGNNLFQEADGTLHVGYVDNYELWYGKSTDGGKTWNTEKIPTGHDGDVHTATLAVDHSGAVFIGFTCHDAYNYANPTGVQYYGNEFLYDLYCANNKGGSWTIDSVDTHDANNFGPLATGIAVDGNNNIHLFAMYNGYWSYGGTAWEYVRSAGTGIWGGRNTVVSYHDTSVDNMIYAYCRPLIDSSGNITLIMSRYRNTSHTDERLFYVRKVSGNSSWSDPVEIDQPNRSYITHYQFDAAIDAENHIYLVYIKDDAGGHPQIFFSTDFGSAAPIYTGESGENIYNIKVHSDANGNLTLLVVWLDSDTVKIATHPNGGSWSSLEALPVTADSEGYIVDPSVVRTNTQEGVFTKFMATYFNREAEGQTSLGPFGPDKFYFYSLPTHVKRADVNADGMVDLADVILALQVLSGMNPDGLPLCYELPGVDVNADNKIGLPEVTYILQVVSGLR